MYWGKYIFIFQCQLDHQKMERLREFLNEHCEADMTRLIIQSFNINNLSELSHLSDQRIDNSSLRPKQKEDLKDIVRRAVRRAKFEMSSSEISISEEELKIIKQMKIYLVIQAELKRQAENAELKRQAENARILSSSEVMEKELNQTETFDDTWGNYWLHIIALLLRPNGGIINQSHPTAKMLSHSEILQWFQTLRSSILFMNDMLTIKSNDGKLDTFKHTMITQRKEIQDLKEEIKRLKQISSEIEVVECRQDIPKYVDIDAQYRIYQEI